jgi:hypothetical protein
LVGIAQTAYAEAGDGLQAGRLVLSPSLSASSGFDSNLFRQSTDEAAPTTAPSVALTPALSISTLDPQPVDLSSDASVTWTQYISGSRLVNAQSGLKADVGADVGFNREGPVSFTVQDRLRRTNEPPPVPAEFAYNTTTNRLGATLGVHPGGKVFQHFLSYDWTIVTVDRVPDIDRQIHNFTLKNYWRFLPRTAAVLTGDYSLIRYNEPNRNGVFENVNSTPLRVSAGLTGLITKTLSLRIIGGWGWGFYDDETSFSGVVLDTQVTYRPGPVDDKNRLFLGYTRNFQDSTIANFATFHRPYAGYEQSIAGRIGLSIGANAMIRDYEGAPEGTFAGPGGDVTISGGLNDLKVGANAGLGFDIRKWWDVGVRYALSANLTDDVVTSEVAGNDAVREYVKHLVTLSTTVRY